MLLRDEETAGMTAVEVAVGPPTHCPPNDFQCGQMARALRIIAAEVGMKAWLPTPELAR